MLALDKQQQRLAVLLVGRIRGCAEERPRLGLARALGLGLEFLLAADIMRTAVAPTWTEIGQLAAIAALRTALNFFIQRELDAAARRRKADGAELSDKETRAQFP